MCRCVDDRGGGHVTIHGVMSAWYVDGQIGCVKSSGRWIPITIQEGDNHNGLTVHGIPLDNREPASAVSPAIFAHCSAACRGPPPFTSEK